MKIQSGQQNLPSLQANALMDRVKTFAFQHPHRVFGSPENAKAAQWLANAMRTLGLRPGNRDSYFQRFTWPIQGQPWAGHNVVGLLEGTDPVLKHEYVDIAAHYDTAQTTAQGANDNATGCAAVLNVAQALIQNPPKRSVRFWLFDGEEGLHVDKTFSPGRRGSQAMAQLLPLENIALFINVDMIGKVHLERGQRNELHQWASDDAFAQEVMRKATEAVKGQAVTGFPEQPEFAQTFTSDAEFVFRRGVPTVNLMSGRDLDNHTPNDEISRIIPDRVEQYAQLAFNAAVEAANAPATLEQMGLKPGGLRPSYPLLRQRQSAGFEPKEETERIQSLRDRVNPLRDACLSMLQTLEMVPLEETVGISWQALKGEDALLSEAVLNRVRLLREERTAAYREIPKDDEATRRDAREPLRMLNGIEDVLSASLYLLRLQHLNIDSLQQVPARARELQRGTKALRLEEDTLRPEDVRSFSAQVTPERSHALARKTVAGLGDAVGTAAYALLKPDAAARHARAAQPEDLLQQMSAPLRRLLDASLRLQDSFARNEHGLHLKPSVSLAHLQEQVDSVRSSAQQVPGTQGVVKELDFWHAWLAAYVALEPFVLQQAAKRKDALEDIHTALQSLPEVDPALTAMLENVAESGETEELVAALHAMGMDAALVDALASLQAIPEVTLRRSPRNGPVEMRLD